MPYFTPISENNAQHRGSGDESLHFAYNANSGGGQAFLPGKYRDATGQLQDATALNGRTAILAFRIEQENSVSHTVELNTNEGYPITPRGTGSSSMKFSIHNLTRPSALVATALMLPPTCAIKKPSTPNASALISNNYWLQSADISYQDSGDNIALFILSNLIFAGGFDKDSPEEDQQYFSFNLNKRISDIIFASNASDRLGNSMQNVKVSLSYFADFYSGNGNFDYQIASQHVANCMRDLAKFCPISYSGVSDPLPIIMRLLNEGDELSHLLANVGTLQKSRLPKNRIYFGAPGTGKSHKMAEDANLQFPRENTIRVTFHPDYTNAQFVGGFRPYTDRDKKTYYRYVPGPFIRAYVKAKQNPNQNVALLIEEINRANPAGVFGDIFQLLDRNEQGVSEYPVAASAELHDYLTEQNLLSSDAETISLPSNLYLWATMNSADQGVYPMDTAFKRRWDFDYIGINENESPIAELMVTLGPSNNKYQVKWNDLRRLINVLLRSARVNEDKLMGPFFINPRDLDEENTFRKAFKSKVLMYLYEDAAKLRRNLIFAKENATYSELCEDFDKNGEKVFKIPANISIEHYPIPSLPFFSNYSNDLTSTNERTDDTAPAEDQDNSLRGYSNSSDPVED